MHLIVGLRIRKPFQNKENACLVEENVGELSDRFLQENQSDEVNYLCRV